MSLESTLCKLPLDWEALEQSVGRPWTWSHHELLDIRTGRVVFLDEGVVRYVRDGEPAGRFMAPWQLEDVPLARQVLADGTGRYAPIPLPGTDDRYQAMLDFTDHPEVREPARRRLLDALDGRGAFRRFRRVVAGSPKLQSLWNGFEREWSIRWLRRWLVDLGIDPGPIADEPSPARRQRREASPEEIDPSIVRWLPPQTDELRAQREAFALRLLGQFPEDSEEAAVIKRGLALLRAAPRRES